MGIVGVWPKGFDFRGASVLGLRWNAGARISRSGIWPWHAGSRL